jgi:putative ABC transport system ATP-binding protein
LPDEAPEPDRLAPREAGDAAACRGVVKIYWTATGEVHALKGVDAVFPSRAITTVVGPSGSGKSSLLRLLACIDRPTAGQVSVGGQDVSSLGAVRRRRVRRRLVGYVFQRPSDNLIPFLTARQHLEVAANLRGTRARQERDHLLDLLGLGDRGGHRPHQLSGGEQQRLAFASAVVGRPALVVADEPTAELDSESARTLMETVRRLRDEGTAFAIATHDPLAVEMADRTLYLRHGALEAETHQDRTLSVIDASGRIQLPPGAMGLFPDRRAVVELQEEGVWIAPP